MERVLAKYIPERSIEPVIELIKSQSVYLKVVNERKTRHGDYRKLTDGRHQITVNASLNPYRFLITLIHEIAHLVAFKKYGQYIKPHGQEWKHCFRQLMIPLIRPEIFPQALLPFIAHHFRNPKASSDTDANLSLALQKFDKVQDKTFVYQLKTGSKFRIYNGKIFIKGQKRVKRFECKEISSGRIYIFQPNTPVELIG